MPFWGLVVTSAGFFIPCVQALRRRAARAHAVLSGALAVTSLCYHGTLHPIAHRVDAIYAHGLGVYHGLSVLARPCAERVASLAVPVYLYFAKSLRTTGRASCLWHMAFHVTSIFSWTAEIWRSTAPDANTIAENSRDAPDPREDERDGADPLGAEDAGGAPLPPAGLLGLPRPL